MAKGLTATRAAFLSVFDRDDKGQTRSPERERDSNTFFLREDIRLILVIGGTMRA